MLAPLPPLGEDERRKILHLHFFPEFNLLAHYAKEKDNPLIDVLLFLSYTIESNSLEQPHCSLLHQVCPVILQLPPLKVVKGFKPNFLVPSIQTMATTLIIS
jgi:hypothetical protein